MQTARQFQNLETLFNTHNPTGTPFGELEKRIFGNPDPTTPPAFKEFSDLYQYALDGRMLPDGLSIQEQRLQSAGSETSFQDRLTENRGALHRGPGAPIHLKVEIFRIFEQIQSVVPLWHKRSHHCQSTELMNRP